MRVREIMSPQPHTCAPDDTLDRAAQLMWRHDVGCLPVLEGGRCCGMVTDRDVAMAAFLNGERLPEIDVRDAMSDGVWSCSADDSVTRAEAIMAARRVRRLPVVEADGSLVGVLSVNDLVRASDGKRAGVPNKEVVHTLATVGSPRLPAEAR